MEEDANAVDTRDDSALDQIAQGLLGATSLHSIIRFGNRACLAAQFEAQQGVLQGIQIGVYFVAGLLDRRWGWRRSDRWLRGLISAVIGAGLYCSFQRCCFWLDLLSCRGHRGMRHWLARHRLRQIWLRQIRSRQVWFHEGKIRLAQVTVVPRVARGLD